jgi:peptidoglycan/xylan/chitin deacetylase (PgdA/CDA1 family)
MLKATLRSIARRPLEPLVQTCFLGTGTCLTYHRISPDNFKPEPFSPNLVLQVPLAQFERQMKHLSENYQCLSLDDFIQRLRTGALEPRSVAVTFDDGYRDNLDLALPVLKKYNVPATIYLTTGLMDGTTRSLWWEINELAVRKLTRIELDWRGEKIVLNTSSTGSKKKAFSRLHSLFLNAGPDEQKEGVKQLCTQAGIEESRRNPQALTWDEVVQLNQERLVTLGAHSVSHAVLSKLSENDLRRELLESKLALEKRLGHEVRHLAYPFGNSGSAGGREFRIARECGYHSAVTTRLGHVYGFHAAHSHAIPRITVAYNDNFSHFTWKLAGLECLFKRPLSRFGADKEDA